ncbi:universal stress protein [Rhodococcus opacus]|uniref:UspA domain-containing protein n=1 Tax=Rhodococcus opacus (strain B4) TaxID=632772 RepID=C1ARU8_RHOOB|nr:universal stress protein [Rhodococcus opacus]BAH48775.1 hypothetical protein ROP_05280 [Rhodococcus opacus B4]
MTVLVAVTDTPEGAQALIAGKEEAERLGTTLLVLNLSLSEFPPTELAIADEADILDRSGRQARDPAVTVLDLIQERPDIERLVIGVKRRSRVGKALLGSISQRLILHSPVPVLAVKNE